jgi:regulator of sigma E protease
MTLVLGLFVLGVLIAVHEWGHYIVARLSGMRVDSFSIGFGPALLSIKGKNTLFRIGSVPFGGYVKIAGLNPHDGTPADDSASYPNRPAWQRFLVLAAGPLMNYVIAYALLVVILVVGRPEALDESRIDNVISLSAAAHAGLKPGDRVVSVNGAATTTWRELASAIQASKGATLRLVVDRDERQLQFDVKPDIEDGIPRLGITPPKRLVRYPASTAVPIAFEETVNESLGIFAAIGALVRREPGVRVEGPPGILQDLAESAGSGWSVFGLKIVQFSLALFMFNLLPIAALDGGRLLFLLIGVVRRRPVSTRVETWVHGVGFLVLIGVFLAVSVGDCSRYVERYRRSAERAPATAPVVLADGGQ